MDFLLILLRITPVVWNISWRIEPGRFYLICSRSNSVCFQFPARGTRSHFYHQSVSRREIWAGSSRHPLACAGGGEGTAQLGPWGRWKCSFIPPLQFPVVVEEALCSWPSAPKNGRAHGLRKQSSANSNKPRELDWARVLDRIIKFFTFQFLVSAKFQDQRIWLLLLFFP